MQHGDRWTLATLTTAISAALNDASNARWETTDIAAAIQEAVREARADWPDERIDSSETYSDTDYRYDLPVWAERVIEVWFEPLTSGEPRFQVPAKWWRQEGTELVFKRAWKTYNGQAMYIHCLAYPTNLLTESKTNGAIADTTTKDLTSAASTFTTDGVRAGDEVIIAETGYAGNGTYYVETVADTTLTLDRAPGTVGTNLDFTVAEYTDIPYKYIRYFSMAWLYEWAARNKPGRDVEENLRWAAYYRQLADRALEEAQRQRRAVRRY